MTSAVSPAILLPSLTARTEFSIRATVALEASDVLLARLRTSAATTAKPLPSFPALAASTAAFRASILVWNAMSSIVFMILRIWTAFSLISAMAPTISCIFRLLSSISRSVSRAISLTCFTLCVLLFTCPEISSEAAASSSTKEACSTAPSESSREPLDTCSLPEAT